MTTNPAPAPRQLRPEPLNIYAVVNGFIASPSGAGPFGTHDDLRVFTDAASLGRHVAKHFGAPEVGINPDLLAVKAPPPAPSPRLRLDVPTAGLSLVYRGIDWKGDGFGVGKNFLTQASECSPARGWDTWENIDPNLCARGLHFFEIVASPQDAKAPTITPLPDTVCGGWVVGEEVPPVGLWTPSTPSFSREVLELSEGKKLIYRGLGWDNAGMSCNYAYLDRGGPRWLFNSFPPCGDAATFYVEIV